MTIFHIKCGYFREINMKLPRNNQRKIRLTKILHLSNFCCKNQHFSTYENKINIEKVLNDKVDDVNYIHSMENVPYTCH